MKKNNDFGTRLEKLCTDRGIPINQLARRLSISPKTLHEWIGARGRLPRRAEHLKSLAEFFGVSLEYLLFGDESLKSIEAFFEKTELHVGLYEISLKRVSPKTEVTKK